MYIRKVLPWFMIAAMVMSSMTVLPEPSPDMVSSRGSDHRVVLGEMFTGTWCEPCVNADAGMDMVLEDPSYFDSRFVLVEYHSGDDYEIPETEERSSYYLVRGYPTVIFDGLLESVGSAGSAEDNYQVYTSQIDARPSTAYYSFIVDWVIEGDTASISIDVHSENNVPITYQGLSAYAVAVEDHDVELESGHILRMTAVDMPINDVPISVRSSGDSITMNGTFEMDPDWVREDMALVFWVQSDTSREVLQAGIGYPEIKGTPGKNSPPQYTGGDLDFSMEEDGVDSHIYMKDVFNDPDKDPMTFGSESSVHITTEVDPDSYLRVIPDADWSGSETIYISAKDGHNPQVSHPMTVTVTPVNDPPRITGKLTGLEFDEDSTTVTSPISSVFNDPDGDGLSYIVENMVHLKAIKNSDDTLTIEPQEDWNGYENLVIKASDGEFETVYDDTVRVRPINDEPTISDHYPSDWEQVEEGGSITLSVTAVDPEGDRLTYTWEVDGTPNSIKSSSFNYEPEYGDSGEHTVLVKVSDGTDQTSHAFRLIVIEGNRAPTARITSPPAGKTYEEGDNVLFMSEVSDPDDPYGRYIEYEWSIDGTMLSNEPTFSYKPDKGTHVVVLTVSDGEFEDDDTVTFVVEEKEGSGIPGFGLLPLVISLALVSFVLGRRIKR